MITMPLICFAATAIAGVLIYFCVGVSIGTGRTCCRRSFIRD